MTASSEARRRDKGTVVPRACVPCQRRKIRCDGKQTCLQCIQKPAKDPCEYSIPQKRGPKKRATSTGTSVGASEAGPSGAGSREGSSLTAFPLPTTSSFNAPTDSSVSSLFALLDSRRTAPPPAPSIVQNGLRPSAQPFTLSVQQQPPARSHQQASTSAVRLVPAPAPALPSPSDELAEKIYGAEEPSLSAFKDLLGGPQQSLDSEMFDASPATSATRTVDHDQGSLRSLAENPATVAVLNNIYWTFIHNLWPILYRSAFSKAPPLLEAAMLAVSCRADLSRQSAQAPTEGASPAISQEIGPALGDFYYARAVGLLAQTTMSPLPFAQQPPEDSNDVTVVQALFLLALRELAQGRVQTGWMYSGSASRMALHLDLHRSTPSSPIKEQERSRVMWACYALDKYISLSVGRPFALRAIHIDTPLPSTLESDEFGYWASDAIKVVPEVAAQYAHVRCHTVSCFIAYIGLTTILERILDSIGPSPGRRVSSNSATRRAAAVEIDCSLETWAQKHALMFSLTGPTAGAPSHILVVQLWYHACCLILHRPFIPQLQSTFKRGTPPGSLPSMTSFAICTQAAREINRICANLDKVLGLYRLPHAVIFIIFQAGTMHLALSAATDPAMAQAGAESLVQCIYWLHQFSETYALSPQYLTVLRNLERLSKRELRPQEEINEIVASRRQSRASTPAHHLFGLEDLQVPQQDLFQAATHLNAFSGSNDDLLASFNPLDNLHVSFFEDLPFTMPISDDMQPWLSFTESYDSLLNPASLA